ncbi:MAG: hypothetical protein RR470_08255 [Vagococcus sp.]|uniref:hypothetical protein n=1 Tax=Vagococcus sp. TaxID=1933889 RepID=UPI002FCA1D5E
METAALPLVKASLGISTTVRDTFLTAIIKGIKQELQDEKGIVLDEENSSHLMFIVDYSAWRYKFKNDPMPRNLQKRLHDIYIHSGGGSE